MVMHGVVEHMFARDINMFATDVEVLAASCSTSFGAQCRRPMDTSQARAALACLASHSAMWFKLEAPQYSQRVGSFLRCLPGGSSAAAMSALRTELRNLHQEQNELTFGGTSIATESAASGAAEDPKATMRV